MSEKFQVESSDETTVDEKRRAAMKKIAKISAGGTAASFAMLTASRAAVSSTIT